MESPRQPYVQSVIRCQAIIRGVLARRTYKQLARDYLRGPLADRNIGFREFIQFEKRYVSILSFILAAYLGPLKARVNTKIQILSEADIRDIFGPIKELHRAHFTFLSNLNRYCSETWPHLRGLPSLFIEWAPNLRLYCEYALNFRWALARLSACRRENNAFKTFLDDIQKEVEFQGNILLGINLEDLLGEPFHRLPCYRFYVDMFARATPPDHPDHDAYFEAYSIITAAYTHMTYFNNLSKSICSLQSLQQSISGLDVHLIAIDRRLVRLDPNVKFIPGGNTKKRVLGILALCTDLLILARARKRITDTSSVLTPSALFQRAFKCRAVLSLDNLVIEQNSEVSSRAINIKTANHQYAIEFESDEIKCQWIQVLRNQVPCNRARVIGGTIRDMLAHEKAIGIEGSTPATDELVSGQAQNVPLVIKLCTEAILTKGLSPYKLFKIGTARSGASLLRKAFESGAADFSQILQQRDCETIATFLLLVLHTLREPLIPLDLMLPLLTKKDPATKAPLASNVQHARHFVSMLPNEAKTILRVVIQLFRHIAGFSSNISTEQVNRIPTSESSSIPAATTSEPSNEGLTEERPDNTNTPESIIVNDTPPTQELRDTDKDNDADQKAELAEISQQMSELEQALNEALAEFEEIEISSDTSDIPKSKSTPDTDSNTMRDNLVIERRSQLLASIATVEEQLKEKLNKLSELQQRDSRAEWKRSITEAINTSLGAMPSVQMPSDSKTNNSINTTSSSSTTTSNSHTTVVGKWRKSLVQMDIQLQNIDIENPYKNVEIALQNTIDVPETSIVEHEDVPTDTNNSQATGVDGVGATPTTNDSRARNGAISIPRPAAYSNSSETSEMGTTPTSTTSLAVSPPRTEEKQSSIEQQSKSTDAIDEWEADDTWEDDVGAATPSTWHQRISERTTYPSVKYVAGLVAALFGPSLVRPQWTVLETSGQATVLEEYARLIPSIVQFVRVLIEHYQSIFRTQSTYKPTELTEKSNDFLRASPDRKPNAVQVSSLSSSPVAIQFTTNNMVQASASTKTESSAWKIPQASITARPPRRRSVSASVYQNNLREPSLLSTYYVGSPLPPRPSRVFEKPPIDVKPSGSPSERFMGINLSASFELSEEEKDAVLDNWLNEYSSSDDEETEEVIELSSDDEDSDLSRSSSPEFSFLKSFPSENKKIPASPKKIKKTVIAVGSTTSSPKSPRANNVNSSITFQQVHQAFAPDPKAFSVNSQARIIISAQRKRDTQESKRDTVDSKRSTQDSKRDTQDSISSKRSTQDSPVSKRTTQDSPGFKRTTQDVAGSPVIDTTTGVGTLINSNTPCR